MQQETAKQRGLKELRMQCERDVATALSRIKSASDAYIRHPRAESLAIFRQQVCNLSTLAAGMGLADVSALAVALDIKLGELERTCDSPEAGPLGTVNGLLASLDQTVRCKWDREPGDKAEAGGDDQVNPKNDNILVVGGQYEAALNLAGQIAGFGHHCRSAQSIQDVGRLMSECPPAVLIADSSFAGSYMAELRALLDNDDGNSQEKPPLIVTGQDDLPSRLQAAQAGAAAYFADPLDVASLVDKIESLLSGPMAEPYRILIVDDDPTLSKIYGLVFEERGWVSYVLSEPMRILKPLHDFSPDVVLMDLYMPGVTGVELAAVIRQFETYAAIPVVFLSMEDDVAKQVRAVSRGGDDFLSKTMRPDHLVAAVESHARRHRVLRSLLSRDGLTGLLNHSHLRVRVEAEVRRAQRMGGKLAMAMLDLDRFKSVNDTYGHLVGDKVLKALSKFLRQRLRATDVVGRFGGEEFVVLLLDIDEPATAQRLMDDIRAGFAELEHEAGGERFNVSFSCGLATVPEFRDAHSLTAAADKALYAAKAAGRNRVMMAPPESTDDLS